MKYFARVCVAILAAGESRRMGACKLLQPLAGSTLLERAIGVALGCAAQQTIVVTGAYHTAMAPIIASTGALEVVNECWKCGQSESVKSAVRYADEHNFDALIIMVADQPFVCSSHLNTLLFEYDCGKSFAYLAATENRNGNPCLFDKKAYPFLMEIMGDEGARALFRTHADFPARYVYFDDDHLFDDVDTPSDYERIKSRLAVSHL